MKKILLLLMFGLGLTFSKAQTPITVDDTQTVQQLIEDVLIIGNCAEVNNVNSPNNSIIGGDSFQSYGSFDGTVASPAFPFDSGIILATNGVNSIPTGFPAESGGGSWAGDPDLEALIDEPGNTNNATVIEFDFIPFVDEISFNYFLASDEWPTFVCSFADTFAFILSGPGISDVNSYDHDANPNTPELSLDLGGLNIATIPGTTIPVNPTNIHDLSTSCPSGALGEFAVPQLYDSAADDDGTTFYNGRTVPLTATAEVIPGQTYTIKLAIADRADTIFNSAVFIESASFDLGGIDLGPDITIANGTAPCEGDSVTLDIGFSATSIQYFWAKDGVIIPGENDQTLVVTEPGVYEAGIQIGTGSTPCFGITPDPVTIEFYPEPEFDVAAPIDLCEGESIVLDGAPTNASAYTSIDYQWSKDGAELAGETNSTLSVTEGGIYEVNVDANACDDATNSFTVNLVDYEVNISDPNTDCIDVGSVVTLIPEFNGSLTQDQIDNEVTYEWTTDNGTFSTPTIDISAGQTVTLTTTFKGCPETDTQTFTFLNNPIVDISGALIVCQDETITLDGTPSNLADLTGATYTWFKDNVELAGETNPTLDVTDGGTYEVIVDNNGCSDNSVVEVELVDYQVTLPDVTDPCVGSGETVTITADFPGIPDDELDQVTYQWSTGEDTSSIELTQGQEVTLTTTYKGCQESVTQTFSFFNNPEVDIAGMDVICAGETNTLDATPMNLNDLVSPTYSWTLNGDAIPGDTPVLDITEGGTYEITVNNNDCIETDTFEVEQVNYTVSFAEENVSITECTGGGGGDPTVILEPIISGLTPAQEDQIFYNWSDGSTGETLTVSESGEYSVDVNIDGNCVKSASVQVSINLIETIQATLTDDVKCPDDEVTIEPVLTSNPDGLTYQWSRGEEILSGETGPTLTVSEEGDYTLVVNNQGCLSNPVTATISNYEVDNCVITQGISPDFNNDGINDCMDLTWLSDESGIRKMTVFNRYGRKVFEENNYVDTFCGQDDNGDELSTGTYFYVIELERESSRLQDGLVIKGWVYLNAEQ